MAAIISAQASFATQQAADSDKKPPVSVLDLTKKTLPDESGFSGIPGEGMGGPIGLKEHSAYQLPLEVRIAGVSSGPNGDFVLEVLLKNASNEPYELPTSRNLTSVERPGNRSQKIFFFQVRPVSDKPRGALVIEVSLTGGTATSPSSFTSLAPGKSLRVLLPMSGSALSRALAQSTNFLDVRVVCGEWQLEENRYFIRAKSIEVPSRNSIRFEPHSSATPVVVEH